MSSKARKKFDKNFRDIKQLIEYYETAERLFGEQPKQDLPEGADVVLRSAIVLLVTYWEAYLEDIAAEAVEHLIDYTDDPVNLPKDLKKSISAMLGNESNEISMWKLAGNGWKSVVKSQLASLSQSRNRSFNTPKSANTRDFIKATVGISDITKKWHINDKDPEAIAKTLDSFVELRGTIAHRGRINYTFDTKVIEISSKFIKALVSKTGGGINSELKRITGHPLWTNER